MPRLDYLTAGESHGPGMLCVVSGIPSGVTIDTARINACLARRQGGYGRGGRQKIERDTVEVLSGVRAGVSMGSPITLRVANRDARLDDADKTPPVFRPRPGHADLAGSIKHLTTDCRGVLERASARETAARVAAGALAGELLREFGIEAMALTRSILGESCGVEVREGNWREVRAARDASETYCPDAEATARQVRAIHGAKLDKDTAGGVVEAHVFGVPPGLGSCADWRDRLDARLAWAVMGVQAIKGVEIGMGMGCAGLPGSHVHDPIGYDAGLRDGHHGLGFVRPTNNAGGIEGGMSNGQPLVVRAAMKPISTLVRGLPSVDLNSKAAESSQYERSDICAVPAAGVVVEAVVLFEVARAFCDKFAGDSLTEVRGQWESYMRLARNLPLDPPAMTLA